MLFQYPLNVTDILSVILYMIIGKIVAFASVSVPVFSESNKDSAKAEILKRERGLTKHSPVHPVRQAQSYPILQL